MGANQSQLTPEDIEELMHMSHCTICVGFKFRSSFYIFLNSFCQKCEGETALAEKFLSPNLMETKNKLCYGTF